MRVPLCVLFPAPAGLTGDWLCAGHIAPLGLPSTLAGEPWASMSDQSNGVFAALNMITYWEYSKNSTFLTELAFPFCRDALKFYSCWMTRLDDGTWFNSLDQANECNPAAPITEAKKRAWCYQNNTWSNGYIRRVARALPSMAKAAGVPSNPQCLPVTIGNYAPESAQFCENNISTSKTPPRPKL